jgi:HD superfamily phosphodiesterase
MKKEGIKLYDLVDLTNTQSILDELKYIVSLMVNDFDHALLEQIHADIKMLFEGNFPGYRASNTKYHDLEHTSAVVLAAARLMHGASAEGHSVSAKTILLGLIGAIFHDIGFIQTDSEVNGSGAKYTIGHEERSIKFMKHYLSQKSFAEQDLEDCTHIIMSTILSLEIKDIPFRSNDIAMLGKIVGSADLLAQMADREYLEKLFMLFKEFEEAGMPEYGSELELLKKTQDFYKHVAIQRLSEGFDNVSAYMQSHFKSRWDLDRDLYQESIIANINYLKIVVSSCGESYGCYLKYLRRGGLAEKLNHK